MKLRRISLVVALVSLAVGAPVHGQDAPFVAEVPRLPQFPPELDIDLFWVPEDNPITAEKVALGWQLFYDPRLSGDETISCASCHLPEAGFADPRPGSVGVGGAVGDRNAPTVINAIFSETLFWDGRAASLEEQAVGPIQNSIEMANTLEAVEARLAQIPGYRQQFRSVFGSDEITAELVGKAIATFERVIVSADSPWDRALASSDESLISASARRGNALFNGEAGCSQCHAVTRITDTPTDLYQNTGVGMDKKEPDLGRFEQSGEDEDRGAFKAPPLRNVSETAPYMHDGSLATLEEVIEYYDRGGEANAWLDEKMKPLELNDQERADILAFLESLTGTVPAFTKRVPRLPPDVPRERDVGAARADDSALGTIRGRLDHAFARRLPAAVYINAIEGSQFEPPAVNPVMDQLNLRYTPHVLPVLAGSTIEFPNNDETRHNVYTAKSSVCQFELGLYPAGVVKKVKCDDSGIVMVLCNVHAEMRGFIVVAPTPYFAATDAEGEFVIDGVPPGNYSITFEHERLASQTLPVTVTAGEESQIEFSGLARQRR